MLPEKIKKRSGDVVEFRPEKIRVAVEKAMKEVRGDVDVTDDAKSVLSHVLNEIEASHVDRLPEVERVQDMVEFALMDHKFYAVAKAYILYRREHQKIRQEKQQETLEKLDKRALSVVNADGKKEKFDEKKLQDLFVQAVKGLEHDVDVEALVEDCKNAMFEGITTSEIQKAAVLTARSFIEKDPAYDFLTARLFLRDLAKEASGEKFSYKNRTEQYQRAFTQGIARGIETGRLIGELAKFDLKRLSGALDLDRDTLFTYRGLQTLYDRYFIRDEDGERRLELPQTFFMRVAMGLAVAENTTERDDRAIEFYEALSTMRFMSSTPTLFHSATPHPQLSSCYLTTVEDDLDHIFKCIGDNAQLSKWSGGLGNDWSNIRATGSLIKSTNVESQGVIPFLKIANDTTVAINRSGKRRGATCAYLETWHYDIEDFLDLRKNTGDDRRRTHDMNTANWIPDLFMKRVQSDGHWTLFSPEEVPDLHHIYGRQFEEAYERYEGMAEKGKIRLYKQIKAKDLWRKMLTMLFETGHPWITFKDPCNIRSPQDHTGVIHSSNLCTEITLNTSKDETAVCNLGSVNLARHVVDGRLDQALIAKTVKTAMRMLDNVIDINFYPTKEAKNANMKHRPVGLGIMGFQDALYMLDINFDSDACVRFADESMEQIAFHAYSASSDLARERGTYQSYKGSKWDRGIFPQDTVELLEKERGMQIEVHRGGKLDWTPVREQVKKYGMRNSNCLAIAPTATISNISGCFPCIEPIYKNLYVKSNMSGEFTVVNSYLVDDLKKIGLWNAEMFEMIKYHDGGIQEIEQVPPALRAKYKEVFEIDPEWLIKAAAHRGKWIDQSQSLNIFLKGTSGKKLADAYFLAWNTGLKTTYYLRTMAASSIEKSTLDINKWKVAAEVQVAVAPENSVSGPSMVASLQPIESLKVCAIDDPTCEACQ